MTSETEILSEADEIAALLPWYVSGKISPSDKARVEAYAAAHPEVRRHIVLAREEADAVFADNQAISPPRGSLDTLHAAIAADPRARLHAVKASLFDRIGEFLGGLAPRQLAYAGIAAALAITIQAASIGSLMSNRPNANGYETASGPSDAAAIGSFALVAFQPAAPSGTVAAFLADSKMTIVDGPKVGGVYRVRLSDKVLAAADTEAALAKLKARADLVAFAAAAPPTP